MALIGLSLNHEIGRDNEHIGSCVPTDDFEIESTDGILCTGKGFRHKMTMIPGPWLWFLTDLKLTS